MLKKVLYVVLIIGGLIILRVWSNIKSWEEEVKLSDGRVIVVAQKHRYEEGVPRETWLTVKLPEFGDKEIVWHESLEPRVLNIHEKNLYVVGFPQTVREFRQYGSPTPPYIGYRYFQGKWIQLSFKDIPVAIYDTNIWFGTLPEYDPKHISLSDKADRMKDARYGQYLKKIDPNLVY